MSISQKFLYICGTWKPKKSDNTLDRQSELPARTILFSFSLFIIYNNSNQIKYILTLKEFDKGQKEIAINKKKDTGFEREYSSELFINLLHGFLCDIKKTRRNEAREWEDMYGSLCVERKSHIDNEQKGTGQNNKKVKSVANLKNDEHTHSW